MLIEIENCADSLREVQKILLLCHAHPDGDTLGSATALALALKAMGKETAVLCDDEIAPKYDFMFTGVHRTVDFEPELIVAVDVADPELLGKNLNLKYGEKVDMCIDHHTSNRSFAQATWLDADSASVAEMVYELLRLLEAEITPQMASCLFTGVSTDTGCFRFSNTTSRSHRIAAEPIDAGADSQMIIQNFFEIKSRSYAMLEKMAMDELQLYLGGRCAIMPVTRAMLGKSGASDSDTDRLANIPRRIEGVVVAVTLKEQPGGEFKASVRTHGDVDASAICGRMGGGGHVGAAGCTLQMPLPACVARIIEEVEKEIG